MSKRVLCKNCGYPVRTIYTNCFNHDGSDSEFHFDVTEPVEGVAEIQLPENWCGNGLSDEEMMEMIQCHHCGEFPFSESAGINIQHVINVVCFGEEEEDD